MKSTLDWQGHRGCRGIMPENTIPGFLKAIDLGVSTIEMDVIISGDGQVVVSHESYFHKDICSPPPEKKIVLSEHNEKVFNLFKMTYEEIAKWDVGIIGNPKFEYQEKLPAIKPLLSEVIDTVERYSEKKSIRPICYSIELKYFSELEEKFHPATEEFARKVAQVVSQYKVEKRCVIQAFNTRIINDMGKINPTIRCSFLFHDPINLLNRRFEKLDKIPKVFGPHHELVNPALLDKFHSLGVKVIPWTVNDLDRIKELIIMGVDGIITDYPNWLKELMPLLDEREITIKGIA